MIPNKVVESLSLGIPFTLSTVSRIENGKPLTTGIWADTGRCPIWIQSYNDENTWRRFHLTIKLYKEVFNSRKNEDKLGQLIQEVAGVD